MDLFRRDGANVPGTDYRAEFHFGIVSGSMKIINAKDIVWQGAEYATKAFASGTGTMEILPKGELIIDLVGLYTDDIRFTGKRVSSGCCWSEQWFDTRWEEYGWGNSSMIGPSMIYRRCWTGWALNRMALNRMGRVRASTVKLRRRFNSNDAFEARGESVLRGPWRLDMDVASISPSVTAKAHRKDLSWPLRERS